ncbi:uncharacterized protein [Spinacia oleracea]|uniref:RNase H type-1 domain-containing protein n=1 Tax=Spinacia oleracea TaxID=3562 RepID=A0ABM3RND9_SPIOL|nr:uncharacterized protein LOC130470650 [Spinacia oleracea]
MFVKKLPPCKEWSKSPIGHCHATAEDEIWRTERECRKNVPATNMTMARHMLTVCFEQYPPDQPELINGFAGGLICDSSGDWVAGFSTHINNDIGIQDCSVLPYLALLKGLKLGWARGLRFLEVKLGFQYHEGFWADFEKDAATGKFDLLTPDDEDRVWTILLEVENCLNQDWFIDVKNTASFKEEAGATALAKVASIKPLKQIYDFPSHRHTATIKGLAKYVERNPQYLRGNTDSSNDLRIYAGLAL